MFEEVPRERHGVARLLPVRRVVLGPFVLGGGMLLATLGGSVAVAAAATVITASALGSNDLPARPGHPAASATSHQPPPATRAPAHHHSGLPPVAPQSSAEHPAGVTATAGVTGKTRAVGQGVTDGSASARVSLPPSASLPAGSAAVARPTAPPSSASPTPAAPSSGPLGNAVIHVSGHDPATGRLAYQFATVQSGAGSGGGDRYVVSDPQTFTAALAPSAIIVSGGGICPQAGSACTPDQVIGAADSGFFAEVAIDAAGALRSIVEVGYQQPTAKLLPIPTTPALPGNRQSLTGAPAAPSTKPAATASPVGSS